MSQNKWKRLTEHSLAKGEVGIRERKPTPTLAEFAQKDFLPHIRTTFAEKIKTRLYYENGVRAVTGYEKLAKARLDTLTTEKITAYIATRQKANLEISSINRELQVLRRMFALATEWGKVDRVLPKVKMVPGEKHRERVLSPDEEAIYLANATQLLRDVGIILLDCALRPEECFRLRWVNVHDGLLEIHWGKTGNARRRIPMSPRVVAVRDMRRTTAASEWVFPAPTKSGHIEPSTLKKPHLKACKGSGKGQSAVERFPLYTLRHTCLTRWAPHMDAFTLATLAGHGDMSITKRYVHPQTKTILEAMKKAHEANSRHTFGHTDPKAEQGSVSEPEVIN